MVLRLKQAIQTENRWYVVYVSAQVEDCVSGTIFTAATKPIIVYAWGHLLGTPPWFFAGAIDAESVSENNAPYLEDSVTIFEAIAGTNTTLEFGRVRDYESDSVSMTEFEV